MVNKKIYKVKFYGGGIMGELARQVILNNPYTVIVDKNSDDFDILFSASYPTRISQEECKKAKLGAVNIHTSLLPEGRGSHPLNWALIWGKRHTGITIHKIVDTYDAGDICLQRKVRVLNTDNIVDLRNRINNIFPYVVKEFFLKPEKYILCARQQNQAIVSYAQKRRQEDSELNLNLAFSQVYNLWRACDPKEYPAFIRKNGEIIFIKTLKYLKKLHANR